MSDSHDIPLYHRPAFDPALYVPPQLLANSEQLYDYNPFESSSWHQPALPPATSDDERLINDPCISDERLNVARPGLLEERRRRRAMSYRSPFEIFES